MEKEVLVTQNKTSAEKSILYPYNNQFFNEKQDFYVFINTSFTSGLINIIDNNGTNVKQINLSGQNKIRFENNLKPGLYYFKSEEYVIRMVIF